MSLLPSNPCLTLHCSCLYPTFDHILSDRGLCSQEGQSGDGKSVPNSKLHRELRRSRQNSHSRRMNRS